jgi:hypothetical protein
LHGRRRHEAYSEGYLHDVVRADERIRKREADAAMQSDGETRQTILKEIAQLRWYADTKRWIESPGLKAAR